MANYKTCRTCGAPLHDDDIAIYRKLVYRGAEDFLCIQCLADYFKCPKEEIEKLKAFRLALLKKYVEPDVAQWL